MTCRGARRPVSSCQPSSIRSGKAKTNKKAICEAGDQVERLKSIEEDVSSVLQSLYPGSTRTSKRQENQPTDWKA